MPWCRLIVESCGGRNQSIVSWRRRQDGCRGCGPAPEEETACGSEAEGLDIVLAASVVDGAELAGGGMIQHTYAMQLSLRGSRASV